MSKSKYIFPDIHILRSELACPCCGQLPPDLYTDNNYYLFYHEWENTRGIWGKPIKICEGGGYRCAKYQFRLILDAKTKAVCSPHFFFALDNDFDTAEECREYAEQVNIRYPDWRIIYKCYLDIGKTFVHVDKAFLVKPKPVSSWIPGFRL